MKDRRRFVLVRDLAGLVLSKLGSVVVRGAIFGFSVLNVSRPDLSKLSRLSLVLSA